MTPRTVCLRRCATPPLQLPWDDFDRFIDEAVAGPDEIERCLSVLENVAHALESNMDYPVDHVAQSGSVVQSTAVLGDVDVIMVIHMKDFSQDLVRCRGVCWGCALGARAVCVRVRVSE